MATAELFVLFVSAARQVRLYDLSLELTPFRQVLALQEALVHERRRASDPRTSSSVLEDALVLAQHHPVFTLGTASTPDNIVSDIASLPGDVIRTRRGGEVTYHGPGQLVAYPIFDLRAHHTPDLHWYLRTLEEVVIGALSFFGVRGERVDGLTGVWVQGHKVCAIGVKVSQWITMHGLALNVHTDLGHFAHIVPCGIADRPVGSLQNLVECPLDIADVRGALLDQFAEQFGVDEWLPQRAGSDPCELCQR